MNTLNSITAFLLVNLIISITCSASDYSSIYIRNAGSNCKYNFFTDNKLTVSKKTNDNKLKYLLIGIWSINAGIILGEIKNRNRASILLKAMAFGGTLCAADYFYHKKSSPEKRIVIKRSATA